MALNLVTIRDTCPLLFPRDSFILSMTIAARVNAIIYCQLSWYALTLYCRHNNLRVKDINRTMLDPGDLPKLSIIRKYTNMALRYGQ